MLAAIGLTGYAAFWIWFFTPKAGHLVSVLLPLAGGVFSFVNYKRLDAFGRRVTKQLLNLLLLSAAVTLLILSVGFLRGRLDNPTRAAAERFSHPLPGDNVLPYLFAEGLLNGRVPKPLQADWLSSDRPPLQTGCVLAQYVFVFKPRPLGYTVASVMLQSLWIVSAWLLLAAFGIHRRALALTLVVCLFSGFVFLNSFFVWPKLFAATYVIGLFVLLFTSKFQLMRRSRRGSILAGVLLALGLLAHGASAFAVLGAACMMLLFHRRMPIANIALLVGTAVVVYAPWICYQKFSDPPGNRLMKWHLAGVEKIDNRSFTVSLLDAYRGLTPGQFVHNKIENVKTLFLNSADFWIELVDLAKHLRSPDAPYWISGALRGWMFFQFVVNLGFLMIGPLFLLAGFAARYRTREWRAAAMMWSYVVITSTIYVLLKFTPGTTLIHAGTYATVLLAYCGSVLALWAFSRVLALLIGSLQIGLHIVIYGIFMRGAGPHGLLPLAPIEPACAVLACIALVPVLWLTYKLSRPGAYEHASEILDCPPHPEWGSP